MKKAFTLLWAILLLSLCSVSFAASSIDLSYFPKDTFNITTDEFTGEHTISNITNEHSMYLSSSNGNSFYTSLFAAASDIAGKTDFSLFIMFTDESRSYADDVMVKIGDNVYTFKNAYIQTRTSGTEVADIFYISDSTEDGKRMFEDWIAHSGNIRIRIDGMSKYDFSVLTLAQIEVAEFYKLYLKSRGIAIEEPDNIAETELFEAIGTGRGFVGDIQVKVTTDGKKITSVEVLSHNEIYNLAIENIPAAIVTANSTDVDTVSGATLTSRGIIEAVNNALLKISDEAQTECYEAIGTGRGFVGDIQVKVTTDGKKITSVEVINHNDTPGVCNLAIENIPAAIVTANSTDVDTVSGATYTSRGIIEAANNALLQLPQN